MSHSDFRRGPLGMWFTGLMVSACFALAGMSSDASARDATQPQGVVTDVSIGDAGFTANVGSDNSFQYLDSGGIPYLSPYESFGSSTGDSGWLVHTPADGSLHGPDFAGHSAGSDAAAYLLADYVPFSGGAAPVVTGTGTDLDPLTATTSGTFGPAAEFGYRARSRFVNGDSYFIHELTVTNNTGSTQPIDIYFASQIRSMGLFRDAASGAVGGDQSGCGALVAPTGLFSGVAHTPLVPSDGYTASVLSPGSPPPYLVWQQMDLLRDLDDQVSTTPNCPDPGGLGLQWNRSIAAGASTTIQMATVLAGNFAIAPFSLASVNPGAADVGANVPVTISGNGFLVDTTFDFGADIGVGNLVIVNSGTATADLVISPSATPGPVDVVATQSANGLTSTIDDGFLVNAPVVPLSLTSISPTSAEAGTLDLLVTINGAGFLPTLALDFGAGIVVSDIVVEEPGLAFATLAIDPAAVPGPRDVVATQGSDSDSLLGGFTVDPVFVPLALTAVAPSGGSAGTPDLAVTVSGAGFDSGLALDFGAGIVVGNIFVQDANTALATLNIDAAAVPGPRDVTATQVSQMVTLASGFTVDPAFVPLALTGVSPSSGSAGTPDLAVTVSGAGFDSGLALDFGAGIVVGNTFVQDANTALATLDIDAAAVPGPRDVTATQGGQTFTLSDGFTVNPPVAPPPLIVLGVDPTHAAAGANAAVTIDVSGLAPPDTSRGTVIGVDFGSGIAVSGISADYASTPQHIFATLDIDAAATPGPRTVTVSNAGNVADLVDGFAVDATTPSAFELTEVHPASGSQGTRVYVVLGGSGFQTDTRFDFGAGTVIQDLRILAQDRASLRLNIAADAPVGPRTVSAIQSPGGVSANLPGAFTIVEPPPVGDGTTGTLVLALTASTPGPLQVGDAFAYTLSLRNFSGAPVSQIRVEDALPANLTVTGIDCSGGVVEEGVLVWSLTGLDAQEGASCDIAVSLDAIAGDGSIVNRASVSYAGGSGQVTQYTTTAIVGTVVPPQVESVTFSGAPTTEDSIEPALSADGSILVFSSLQKDLVESNANISGGADVYLRDRRSGEMRVINRHVDGYALVGESRTPDISLNGQAIAFVFRSMAVAQGTAKGGDDGSPSGQLCSSQPNSLFQMECDTTGVDAEPLDGDVESPSLSADGKSLVFCSSASNWVADDTNGAKDVFLKDQTTGAVTRVSVTATGEQADGESCNPMISADGNYVAFTTVAPNLGGSGDAKQIVRKDLTNGELLVVTGDSGAPADADAGAPSISADGSRIAFASRASNLVAEADGGQRNLFIFQAADAPAQSLAKGGGSANSLFVMLGTGDELPDGDSSDPKIACSGNAIGFTSEAGNLVDDDTNAQNDYFVYGIASGSIVRPGPEATGTEPDGDAADAALDCEATTGAYDSTATGPGNPNPNADVMSQGDPLRAGSGTIVLDGSFSGNWYDPGQSGHGFLLEALPGGDFYATWYVYHDGEPLFLQGRATPSGNELSVSMYDARSTGFPVGADGVTTRTWGTVTFSFSSSNDAVVSWVPVVEGFMPGSMNLRRLSRAALVQSNRDEVTDACYSGIWYDRSQSGYGFDIEFNDMADGNRTVTAYWYTYQPDGEPLWLIGTGLADADGASMDLYRFSGAGAQFPPAFSASALSRNRWGEATLRFAPDQLRVDYAATLPGYGSGTLNLQRLTVLAGRGCGE